MSLPSSKEARILLAKAEIESAKRMSIKNASQTFRVPRTTLSDRIQGKPSRRECTPNSSILTINEEEALIKYILDRDDRGFGLKLAGVEDMANMLLQTRGAPRVGSRWAQRFVQRKEELKPRYSRSYDFQRALCEDPNAINAWFRSVWNMKAKYGIADCDLYNFDETGFMIGIMESIMIVTRAERKGRSKKLQPGNREWASVIHCVNGEGWSLPPYILLKGRYHLASWYTETNLPNEWALKTTENGWTDNETGVDWLKHFDQYTASRTQGAYRMLILDGHESHTSEKFHTYCETNKIIPLCLPPHSSHLTQPLDIGCFGPLKRAYGDEINTFIMASITHITKDEFLIAFRAAYFKAIIANNIKAGFRGAGLIPHNPQAIISKLDIKLRTPTPPLPGSNVEPWTSQTPNNPQEAISQSEFVKNRLAKHKSSSPTPILAALESTAKGLEAMAHNLIFIQEEVRTLREANKALSKRRRAKKTRLRDGGSLTVSNAIDILDSKNVDAQLQGDLRRNGIGGGRGRGGPRRCGRCHNIGHNSRTCQIAISEASKSDSE